MRTAMVGKLLPLAFVVLAVGISTALFHPFLALFLSTEVAAGPVRVTAFLIAAPLAGVIAAALIARLSDRRAIRRGLLITAALTGCAGSVLSAYVRNYWVLLGLAVTAFALAGSLFPQTFAYARQVLQRDDPARATMGISSMRTVFSIAWVAGPPLAAVLLEAGGFRYVYGTAAAMYLFAALVAIFWLERLGPVPAPEARPREPHGVSSRGSLILIATAFTLLQCPLTLGAQALPLFVSRVLGGEVSAAGLLLGLCAALEIPLMLAFGVLAARIPIRRLILAGAGCGVAYYAIVTAASGVGVLYPAQLINALFIAAVTGLGITYVQDLLPAEPGRATTLFTNTFPIGSMLAGPMFGLAQNFGFRWAYAISTALCLGGLLVLMSVPRPAGPALRGDDSRPSTQRWRSRS
ncbi:MAG TPA: sugar efflux transporter [Actinoplanes sp.]|nr:sugar efflux transporter [Actinoplanes sp.]